MGNVVTVSEKTVTGIVNNINAEDYEIIDVFEFKDAVYAAVTPYQEEYDEDIPLEITMLQVNEENGEEYFTIIENEAEELAAYEELLRRDEEYED